MGQDLFPSDPMATLSGEELAIEAGETTVRITIREQFSTVYDDAGSTPSCYLEGSIYVRAKTKKQCCCCILHFDTIILFDRLL